MAAMQDRQDEDNLLSEQEAAEQLGVSVNHLHRLLDKHVFHGRYIRPTSCTFRSADLVLLRFWASGHPEQKILQMPSRK